MPVGTPVYAARGGVVVDVEESNFKGGWKRGYGKYANYIVIQHADGSTGEYYHLSQHGAYVEQGDTVHEGQLIGLSGNTGHTAMPHLHFGVYHADTWGKTKSIKVRFKSRDGIIENPRRGRRYSVK
ncbi:MAG: M23 family metallopeptidase [Gammaproteobacteria bacterium]|nr:M23 family metallopeptidase [Gammaproteobacteria bacterium]